MKLRIGQTLTRFLKSNLVDLNACQMHSGIEFAAIGKQFPDIAAYVQQGDSFGLHPVYGVHPIVFCWRLWCDWLGGPRFQGNLLKTVPLRQVSDRLELSLLRVVTAEIRARPRLCQPRPNVAATRYSQRAR